MKNIKEKYLKTFKGCVNNDFVFKQLLQGFYNDAFSSGIDAGVRVEEKKNRFVKEKIKSLKEKKRALFVDRIKQNIESDE